MKTCIHYDKLVSVFCYKIPRAGNDSVFTNTQNQNLIQTLTLNLILLGHGRHIG